MAGIFDCWEPPAGGETLYTYTIITVDASKDVSFIHHRQVKAGGRLQGYAGTREESCAFKRQSGSVRARRQGRRMLQHHQLVSGLWLAPFP